MTCPTAFKKPCPTTPKHPNNCVATQCLKRAPGFGRVTIRNCFGRNINRLACAYTDEYGNGVCNKRSNACEDGGRAFEFVAACNSTVSLILSDARFVPNGGAAPLDIGATACAGKLRPRRLCKSCGPFMFSVSCPSQCA